MLTGSETERKPYFVLAEPAYNHGDVFKSFATSMMESMHLHIFSPESPQRDFSPVIDIMHVPPSLGSSREHDKGIGVCPGMHFQDSQRLEG